MIVATVPHHVGHHWPWFPVQHWLSVHLGISNESSTWYAWFSGSGAVVIGLLVFIPSVLTWWWLHTCRDPRTSLPIPSCWRWGHHTVTTDDGVSYRLCNHHHPGHPGRGKVTVSHIENAIRQHEARSKA